MKILLVSSNFEEVSLITASFKNKLGVKISNSSHYPLGLAYLHAYLEKNFEVKTLFLNNRNYRDCFEKTTKTIEEFKPDLVGFQIITANRASTYKLLEYIHVNYPQIKQLIGGIHTTLMHEQLIKKFPYVIALLGESEITFNELAFELSRSNPQLRKIDGIAFSENGVMEKTNPRKLIENLDDLPLPKHELFFDQNRTAGCLMTARGCPFNCSFCCLDVLSQRRVRMRSVINIIEEVEMMIQKFPQMKEIWIHDDTFFIDNRRVIEFCDEIIKRKIKVSFTCSGRMKPLSQEMVYKLEQANFKKVLLGLESGDEGVLKKCHKMITQEDATNAFKMFAKTKISLTAFLIVGLPGETLETIKETAKFVQKLQKIKYIYYNDCAVLTVYPGTEVYEIAKAAGKIDDSYWLTDLPTPLYTAENSQEQLFKYKEILLNYIALPKIFTPAGFIAQFTMIPYVLVYLLKGDKKIKFLFYGLAQKILPKKIFNLLKTFVKTFKNEKTNIKNI
jgi:radical SAM superfamily enzyme YgiQ (UPF0313 family)